MGARMGEMAKAIEEAGAQFVALLRSLDADDGGRPVPGLRWTAAETAAHMLTIVRRGTGDQRRASSLEGLAALNDQCVAEVEARDVHEIADALEQELARLGRGLGRLDDDAAASIRVELHAGVTTDVAAAVSYILFDLLGHGWDIAGATGRPWAVDPALAALDLHACLPILVPWVKASVLDGPGQRLALGFPTDADAVVVEAGDGAYSARDEPRQSVAEVTEVAEVDPVETFLALAGRAPATTAPVQRLASWFEPI